MITTTREQMEQERVKIADIEISSGRYRNDPSRTVASLTGLPEDTLVVYAGRISRWTGTGYKNSYYRLVVDGRLSDDVIIIRHCDGRVDDIWRDNVSLDRGFFARRREYGAECGKAARKYRLPFDVVKALGPERCEEFVRLTRDIMRVPCGRVGSNMTGFADIFAYELDNGALGELKAGINRRTRAILGLMPDMSVDLQSRIENLGQVGNRRIANYLSGLDNYPA